MSTREQAIGKTLEQIDALKIDWESYYPIMENQDGQLICTGLVNGYWPNEFNNGNWSICGDDAYAMADAPESDETFHGANYTIRYTSAGQYFISHPQGSETFDSFTELSEAHPVTEEAWEFFFGDDIHDGSGDEYGDDDPEPPVTGLITDDE